MKSNSDDTQSLADREFLAAFSETVKNGGLINWRYWIKDMQKLNAAEAARLMCGLDPDVIKNLDFQSEGVKDKENDSRRECRRAAMIQRLAERNGKESARPDEWIAWASEHQIAVHDGFILEVESAPEKDATKPAPVADGEWITQAQARAREIIKESREHDRYPSQENISGRIAAEFRKSEIFGSDGKPLSGAYIKRHALKGITSAIGKQLSTTIGRGKQGNK